MKIYEKPMALIENIEVEDVITVSVVTGNNVDSVVTDLGSDAENVKSTIIFEW